MPDPTTETTVLEDELRTLNVTYIQKIQQLAVLHGELVADSLEIDILRLQDATDEQFETARARHQDMHDRMKQLSDELDETEVTITAKRRELRRLKLQDGQPVTPGSILDAVLGLVLGPDRASVDLSSLPDEVFDQLDELEQLFGLHDNKDSGGVFLVLDGFTVGTEGGATPRKSSLLDLFGLRR